MTRRYAMLAWTAATCTYLLIVLGAVVRITGSGLGCGTHWPLCNGHLFPPLDDIGTVIEWSHRLVAGLVTSLVVALAVYTVWLQRRAAFVGQPNAAFVALGLLALQIALGAITVKLELPPWTVILHLATAMLLLATLLVIAREPREGAQHAAPLHPSALLILAFITVLFGALTANLGAAAACTGFPLCSGQVWPVGGTLVWIHWIHRLLAYGLAISVIVWLARARATSRWQAALLGLVLLQVAIGATTVLLGLPRGLQAGHVAVGTAVWACAVLAVRENQRARSRAPGASNRFSTPS